jgi:amino acid adenylation domain-containing protein
VTASSGLADTVHGRVAAQAAKSPDAVAVSCAGRRLTYGELDAAANRFAHALLARGAGPEQLVGVCLDRSIELPVVLLAILKTGAGYLPLDPGYPAARLRFMVADARPAVIVTGVSDVDMDAPVVPLGEILREQWPVSAPPSAADAENQAYVMYTSGSTGTPHGVSVPHRAIVNLVGAGSYVRFAPDEVFLHAAPLAFDASTFEIWGALANGARLAIFPGRHPAPAEIGEVIRRDGVTTLWLTAGLFHRTVTDQLADLRPVRQLLAGGDVLSVPLVRQAVAGLPECRIVNGYGPTEATTFTCCHPISGVTGDSVPIGTPIDNVTVYVLDERLNPVPRGEPGELYVGGAGVTRGYTNRPALTAGRFVPDPFSTRPGARMYRTGDRARWSGGALEYLGRRDRQVKLRGYRIELGEIEAALSALSHVREAIVVVSTDGAGDKQLTGYVTGTEISGTQLRESLAGRLPEFLVPSVIMVLDRLPLTANGKVDRAALPAPRLPARAGRAPQTPAEQLVAGALARILGTGRVGADDGFFELGVNSLQVMRLTAQVREISGTSLSVRDVFAARTVAGLAARLGVMRGENPDAPIPPTVDSEDAPLSFAQERLWLLDQLQDGRSVYNVPLIFRARGPLRAAALRDALRTVVGRHEALRTVFPVKDGVPYQRIEAARPFTPVTVDLSALPQAERAVRLRAVLAEQVQEPFDLARGPLVRAALVVLGPQEHVFALTAHHIVTDGWSMGVLQSELAEAYAAAVSGRPSTLTPLPLRYRDFARWQRSRLTGGAVAPLIDYWRTALRGISPLRLPTDRPRPPVASYRGRSFEFTIPADLVRDLRRLSRDREVTSFMTLLAAFQVLLARYSGQTDICVGVPAAGRDRPELDPLIGFFVNTLVLRGDLGGNPTFGELLERTRDTALDAYAHQQLPFDRLVDTLGVTRDAGRNPLVQVVFAVQNTPGGQLGFPGLSVSRITPQSVGSKFDLSLSLSPESDVDPAGALRGVVEYSTDLFEFETVRRLTEHYEILLRGIVRTPNACLADLPVLTPAEQVLFDRTNATDQPVTETTVHELVAARASRSPDAVALCCGDVQLTYRELDARANQLARVLQGYGAGVDSLIGVCLRRSVQLPLVQLAVLKAGGAYVPLDPEYPVSRLRFILGDAAPAMVLTTQAASGCLPGDLGRPVLVLDAEEFAQEVAAASPAPLPRTARPDDLAYVMYTSGSTGVPKGVAVAHRGVTRLVTSERHWRPTPADVHLFMSPSAFDAATLQIWGALVSGGRLVVFPPELSPLQDLGAVVRRFGVTILVLVSGLFQEVANNALRDLRSVRLMMSAGDVMPVPATRRVLTELPDCELVNGYGPTEDTCLSTSHRVDRGAELAGSVPIGTPLAGTEIHVLDDWLNHAPVGVPGELYLGGAGLARGYLGRPGLTARSFVPSPSGEGARLYRTGDRVRRLPGGALEFLGRTDGQVKIRGYRVEIGEIEAVLREHDSVHDAVVTVLGDSPATRRLVASVVGSGDLRSFLAGRLPDFMVPARISVVEAFPMGPSGKIDRKAVAAAEEVAPRVSTAPARPGDATEAALSEIWGVVLDTGPVGVQQNFFELGGNSLLLARVRSRIRDRFGLDVPLVELFRQPTVAALAQYIRGGGEQGLGANSVAAPTGQPRSGLKAGRDRLSRLRALRSAGTGE